MNYDLYTRMYLRLSSHRRLVIAAMLLIAAVSIVISARMHVDEDILSVLPRNDRLVDEYRYTMNKFRQIDRVFLDVGIATDDTETLGRAADEMYAKLAADPAFIRIMYRIEMGGQRKVVDFLAGALPVLFTEADAQELAPKIDPVAVRGYLTEMRRKLAGPEGMVLKDLVAADPIGMSALVLAKVLPLQSGMGEGARIEDGRITSRDGRHVLVMAEPKYPSSKSSETMAVMDGLLRAARDVERRFPGVRVAITGGLRMTVDNTVLIKGDARRCIFLGMAAMFALCLTAFRRRWLAVMAFLPSLFGTLVAAVALAMCWRDLSAISMGFATIAIGITVDYAIYVIYHLDNAAGLDRPAVGKHVGDLVIPIGVGALTTIAAFVVMIASPMRGYQQLGVFGAVGVLFSAAFALAILPLLVPIPKDKDQPPLWLTGLMARFFNWRARRLPWLLLGVAVLSVVTLGGVRRLRFEGDIAKFNGITEATRKDDELISATWGNGLDMTLVIARGATLDEALAHNDRVAETLAHEPGVTAVSSLASVCPSRATQSANVQRWHAFWTPERRGALHQTLQQLGAELGFREDAFASFWKRVEGEPEPVTLETFRESPIEQALSQRIASGAGDYAVSTMLKIDGPARAEQLRRALPGMIVIDKKAFAEHIAGVAKAGLLSSSLWTTLLVAAILLVSFRSIKLVIATLLPLAFGLLWTFGLMGWLGLPVDMMNSIFVIFVIGVAEDYSVFLVTCKLDEWRGRPQQLPVISASMLISALATIFGFAVLIFARHPVLYSMGTTVLIGIVSAFIATVIMTPLCMDLIHFKEARRKRRDLA